MHDQDLLQLRLTNQHIAASSFTRPEEVVAWMGAMQAQDYLGVLWAVSLRLAPTAPAATEAAVEQAIAERKIVRTWPMRGTLHLVAATDVHWMLDLLAVRAMAGAAGRRSQLGLDEATLAQSRNVVIAALEGGRQLTREQMFATLQAAGISTEGQRGYHILGYLAHDGLLCFGARQGKQHAFALLDEWVLNGRRLERDTALRELALRYFTSHGPATLNDFVWWAGLKITDGRKALALAGDELEQVEVNGKSYWLRQAPALPGGPSRVHLLPGFDEYMLGYQDRSLALDPQHANRIVPGGNGMFMATLVVDGRVVGVWKRTIRKNAVLVEVEPFEDVPAAAWSELQDEIAAAAARYGRHLQLHVTLE